MPTLIKLKRSVTKTGTEHNNLTAAQLDNTLYAGEPFIDTKTGNLIIGRDDGETIRSHFPNISQTQGAVPDWNADLAYVAKNAYQPLVRGDEQPVVIGNTERIISLNSFDRGPDDKGIQLNVDSGYALEINGAVIRGIKSTPGETGDYGDKYVYIGGNNEYNNVAITSHGSSSGASPYGIMSITNTNSAFRDFVRLRFLNSGNVELYDYIANSGTPSTPIRHFKVQGLNTMQRGGYFSIDGQVNDGKYGTVLSSDGIDVHGSGRTTGGTLIRRDSITSTRVYANSVSSDSITPSSEVLSIKGTIDLYNYRNTGSVYQPIYINGEGSFSACAIWYMNVIDVDWSSSPKIGSTTYDGIHTRFLSFSPNNNSLSSNVADNLFIWGYVDTSNSQEISPVFISYNGEDFYAKLPNSLPEKITGTYSTVIRSSHMY